jgi:DNA-binding transcriptional MocR family regulator
VRGPEILVNRLTRLKAVADLGSSLPSQLIALRLLPHVARIREARTALLRERLALLEGLLGELLPSWRFLPPGGGLYAWVKLPGGDATRLAQIASRRGVTVMPGGTLSVGGSHDDHVRLSLAPDPDVLAAGLHRLSEAWEVYGTPLARRSTEPAVIV